MDNGPDDSLQSLNDGKKWVLWYLFVLAVFFLFLVVFPTCTCELHTRCEKADAGGQ
jgi:hypothetical protein